jgi:hypothetical protein
MKTCRLGIEPLKGGRMVRLICLAPLIAVVLLLGIMLAQGSVALGSPYSADSRYIPLLDYYPSNYPHAPENITTMPGLDYIDVTWEPTHYDGGSPVTAVYIYNVGWDNDATPIARLGPEARSYRVTNLVPGNSYTFFMRSENANGIGWWSSSDWAVPGRTVPSVPTSFHVTAGQAQANLTWAMPSIQGGKMVLGYRVYGGANNTDLEYIHTAYESNRNYVDVDLQIGTIYYYQVSAYNVLGEGARSGILSIRSNYAPRNFMIAPNNFNDCEPHNVTFTWSHPSQDFSDIVAYRVYIWDWYESTLSPRCIATLNPGSNSTVIEDAGGWGGSSYSVAAVYGNGDEVFSNGAYVGHPICEGVYYDSVLVSVPVVLIAIIVTLVAFIFFTGNKRKNKR